MPSHLPSLIDSRSHVIGSQKTKLRKCVVRYARTILRSRPMRSTLTSTCTCPSLIQRTIKNLRETPHRMAYIEENMQLRRTREQQAADANTSTGMGSSTAAAGASADTGARPNSSNAQDDVFDKLDPRYKVERKLGEEGSVTNSLSMLTAIPEVDLGIKYVPSFSMPFSNIKAGD